MKKGKLPLVFQICLCVDATEENDTKGRLINHSRKEANLKMRVVVVDGEPRIVFIALRRIANGTELLYDYGDRRKDIVKENSWLE